MKFWISTFHILQCLACIGIDARGRPSLSICDVAISAGSICETAAVTLKESEKSEASNTDQEGMVAMARPHLASMADY
jgi:hypothetical protein